MKCRIKAFGISREIIGDRFLELELPNGYPVVDFKKELFSRYPKLLELRSLYVAVNNEYASDDIALQEGDEIALIPPVSGG
jgi:molybdopterin synthase sulfur carrier subunit